MQSAAGGTSQRLNPDFATVCSRSRIPLPTPATVPALSTVAIRPSYNSPTGRGHQLRSAEHLERLTPGLLPCAISNTCPGSILNTHSNILCHGTCPPEV